MISTSRIKGCKITTGSPVSILQIYGQYVWHEDFKIAKKYGNLRVAFKKIFCVFRFIRSCNCMSNSTVRRNASSHEQPQPSPT
jgi:hypothetical protein